MCWQIQFKIKNIVSILRSRFILLFMLGSCLLPAITKAQVNFTTIASSKEIGRTDYVQVEFVVENAQQIEHLVHPSFQDFHIVQGPIQSSGMSIVNGAMSQYKALSFVLQPIRTGKFTIPGATATINGKRMHSNAVTIIVNTNNTTNNSNNNPPLSMPAWPGEPVEVEREYFLKPGENIAEKIRKNLFVKVDVSKTNCYVGEPIVATYKLYSRVQSESRVTKHPSLNGFSVYDMVDPNNDASSVEKVNGKSFTVHVIRKAQLIPLQAGIIDLDPVEIENTVHFLKNDGSRARNNNSARDIFDDLLEENAQGVPVDEHITLESKPVAVSVKPLPDEKKPADFNGAVGHFSVDANIETKNITAQDAAILKLTIKGKGNLPVVNAPAIQWPTGIENYDATTNTKEDIDKTIAPLSGSKTFEYSFIPKQAGNYIIPAVQFSYFDPVSSSYRTVGTRPMSMSVALAKNNRSSTTTTVSKSGVKEAANNFTDFLQEHLEWFFAVLILSGLAIYLLMQNRRLKKDQEQVQQAAKVKEEIQLTAIPVVVDPLQEARQLLEAGDYRGFYAELNRALWNAVAGKLNLPASELNKYNISLQLQARGWQHETTTLLKDILNECEMKLYTPDYNTENMQSLLQQAESLLKQFVS